MLITERIVKVGLNVRGLAPDQTVWIVRCVCGNRPGAPGFYPCTHTGEPAPDTPAWMEPLYACLACNRIFNLNTLEVVAYRSGPVPDEVLNELF